MLAKLTSDSSDSAARPVMVTLVGMMAIALPALVISAVIPAVILATGSSAQAQTPAVVRPDLEVGVQDSSVSELQAVLKLLGFYNGAVSGSFSAETSQAVAQFQTAAGIPATGRVSARTWNQLFPPASDVASGTASGSTSGTAANSSAPVASRPLPKPRPPIVSSEPAAPAPQPRPAPEAAPTPRPAPAAQPEAEPNPFPTLREGAEGEAVARLQRLLKRQDVFPGTVDGDFGPMTLEAVIAAQEKLGLEADGVVGPATWRALRQ